LNLLRVRPHRATTITYVFLFCHELFTERMFATLPRRLRMEAYEVIV